MKRLLPIALVLLFVSCGGGSGENDGGSGLSPSPSTYNLTGVVTDSRNGQGVGGATLTIHGGPNSGQRATTDGGGRYQFDHLAVAGFTLDAEALYYQKQAQGVNLTADSTQNFSLKFVPPWSACGTGDTVFDMPTTIRRVKITGDYNKRGSNFIVHIGGDYVVNELIGTGYDSTHFEGTYLTDGGTVEILHSSGVRWCFTEVR